MAIGIAGLAAGVIGDVISSQSAQGINQTNVALAQEQMNWQTQMSNTAMQRRVADLKAAGLNPMLAVGQGGAGGVSPVMPQLQNPGASFANLGQQATSAIQAAQQVRSTDSQVALNTANASQANANATEAYVRAAKAGGVDTDLAQSQISNNAVQQQLMLAQADKTRADSQLSQAQVQVAQAQLPKIQAEIQALGAARSLDDAKAATERLAASMSQLNINQFKSIAPDLLTQAHNAAVGSYWSSQKSQADARSAAMDLTRQLADQEMWSRNPGLSYVNAVTNWFHLGANIGGK